MSDQLPQSKAHSARQSLLASLRGSRRKDPPAKSLMVKVPAELDAWLIDQANEQGFDNRQGLVLSILRREQARLKERGVA